MVKMQKKVGGGPEVGWGGQGDVNKELKSL